MSEVIQPIKTDRWKFHILSIVSVVSNLIRLIHNWNGEKMLTLYKPCSTPAELIAVFFLNIMCIDVNTFVKIKHSTNIKPAYRKIPKISPSKYKLSPGVVLGNCPQIQSKTKQKINLKFPSNYKASPIDFEMQISLHRWASPKISPPMQKGPLKNISAGACFRKFAVLLKYRRAIS